MAPLVRTRVGSCAWVIWIDCLDGYLNPVSVISAAAHVVKPVIRRTGSPEASCSRVRSDRSWAGEHVDDQVALQHDAQFHAVFDGKE